ncbi:MAG: FHA domain-containing protein, partial [Clostridiales bacterium]|nr:FHA domain-containing protein [Clostridiales bacterium]
ILQGKVEAAGDSFTQIISKVLNSPSLSIEELAGIIYQYSGKPRDIAQTKAVPNESLIDQKPEINLFPDPVTAKVPAPALVPAPAPVSTSVSTPIPTPTPTQPPDLAPTPAPIPIQPADQLAPKALPVIPPRPLPDIWEEADRYQKFSGRRKAERESSSVEKKEEQYSKKSLFLIVQVSLLFVIVLITIYGITNNRDLNLNSAYLFGLLIAAAGIDFILYREWFKNSEKKEVNKADLRVADLKEIELFGSDDTVIDFASDNPAGGACLEYYENGLLMKIKLYKPRVIVGRLASQVDQIIRNNKIGKVHAEFIIDDGNYYVKDNNSTNGTYINGSGKRIPGNTPYQIYNGDRVTLANTELTLRC